MYMYNPQKSVEDYTCSIFTFSQKICKLLGKLIILIALASFYCSGCYNPGIVSIGGGGGGSNPILQKTQLLNFSDPGYIEVISCDFCSFQAMFIKSQPIIVKA